MATKTKSKKTSIKRSRKNVNEAGFESLLHASLFQGQALLIEMARNHATDVLKHMTDFSLKGAESAVTQMSKAIGALEKAYELLLNAELAALEKKRA